MCDNHDDNDSCMFTSFFCLVFSFSLQQVTPYFDDVIDVVSINLATNFHESEG